VQLAAAGFGDTVSCHAERIGEKVAGVADALVVDIVSRAMTIWRMAESKEDSPYTLGRTLRDAHGAAGTVDNDRISSTTAQVLLVYKDE